VPWDARDNSASFARSVTVDPASTDVKFVFRSPAQGISAADANAAQACPDCHGGRGRAPRGEMILAKLKIAAG